MKSASHLEHVLTSGEFAVTGELGPPKNGDPEVVRKESSHFKRQCRRGQHYRLPDSYCPNVQYRRRLA